MAHTVKDICERYAVTEHTVLAWIHSGDLRAINVAPVHGRMPKWRIANKALENFEQSRTTYAAPVRTTRRRRQLAGTADRY